MRMPEQPEPERLEAPGSTIDPTERPTPSVGGAAVSNAAAQPEAIPLVVLPTLKSVIDDWLPRLHAVRDAWGDGLPSDAESTWIRGAVYLRVSSAMSLQGDSPDTQLRNVLAMLAQKRIHVGRDAVFFDVESGTDIGPRAAFKRLFEAAIAGGYQAIGCFINERMFRNLEQSIQIKRQFRLAGIQLVYLGMYEGDRRNPAAWQMETMQDTTAELHARNTSYYVGLHFESVSRMGRPVGKLPEVYTEKERAPTFLGRRGSILSWKVVEPLGSIMTEGCRRYLAGDSLTELATWAATTEVHGLTPKGRVMDKRWWYSVLDNPKFAGYQMPCVYTGYKPGVESPRRPLRNRKSELVECQLPALWTLDDYHEIVKTMQERWLGRKTRASYRSYLLSGIAYDAACGHVMNIAQRRPDGGYLMECRVLETGGRHSQCMRADVAAKELDELLSGLSFDDEGLQRQIEEELRELSRSAQSERERFRADPAIAALRQARALVAGMDDLSADLDRRISALEAADASKRDHLNHPVVEYRGAIDLLRTWHEVWKHADISLKNQLLREAGLRVELGRQPSEVKKRRPAHVLGIAAANPIFEIALATALSSQLSTFGTQQTGQRPSVSIPLRLSVELCQLAARAMHRPDLATCISVLRPPVPSQWMPHTVPPILPDGPWLTCVEAGQRLGMERSVVVRWIHKGRIEARLVMAGAMPWWMIREQECERILLNRRLAGPDLLAA